MFIDGVQASIFTYHSKGRYGGEHYSFLKVHGFFVVCVASRYVCGLWLCVWCLAMCVFCVSPTRQYPHRLP